MSSIARIQFANSMRGIAALVVVIAHFGGVFWLRRNDVSIVTNAPPLSTQSHPTPNLINWLHIIQDFNWDSYGVGLFFLVSGFVIPFSLQKMSSLGFLVNRLFRIWPTYIIGFSITLLALWGSSHYFSKEWPFSIQEVAIHYVPGLRDLMWSRYIDYVVWTLEVELKFYLLGALCIVWFRKYSRKVFILPLLLFSGAICLIPLLPAWANSNPTLWIAGLIYFMGSQYLVFLFIGVLFHYLYCGRLKPLQAYLGIGGLFALFGIQWWAGPYTASSIFVWSYGFAIVTFAFAFHFPKIFQSNRIFDFLADISYPLYVIHGVAGYVSLRVLLDQGWPIWVALFGVIATIFFVSWLLHIWVERPSQKMGKTLATTITSKSQIG